MLNQKLNRGAFFSFVPFPDFQLKFKIIKFQHRSYLNFCLFVQNECRWVADVVLIKNLTLFIYNHFDAIYRFIIDWDTIHDDDTNCIRQKQDTHNGDTRLWVLLCRESRFLLLCCVSWRLKKDDLRNFGKIYWIRKKKFSQPLIRMRRVHFD